MQQLFWIVSGLFLLCITLLGFGLNEKLDVLAGWNPLESYEAGRVTAFLIFTAATALVVGFVVGIFRLIGAGFRFVHNASAANASSLDVLISLAIVIIGFQTLAGDLYAAILDLIRVTVTSVPRHIAQASSDILAVPYCDATTQTTCFVLYLEIIMRPLVNTADELFGQQGIRGLSAGSLIIAIALWALLIWVFSSAQRENSWWRRFEPEQKRVGAYLLLAVFSSYIGISALLAFALFDDDSGDERQLRGELDEMAQELEKSLIAISNRSARPAVAAQTTNQEEEGGAPRNFRSWLSRINNAPSGIAQAEGEENITQLSAEMQHAATRASLDYLRAEATLAAMLNIETAAKVRDKEIFESLRTRVLLAFNGSNRGRISQKELSDHEAALVNWFAERSFDAQNRLARCRDHIEDARLHLAVLRAEAEAITLRRTVGDEPSAETDVDLDNNVEEPFGDEDLPPGAPPFPAEWGDGRGAQAQSENSKSSFDRAIKDAKAECQTRQNFASNIPQRAVFGSSLGPVATWTSWLLSGESEQLSLIIGLIGFGLLGATASNYFRPTTGDRSANWQEGGGAGSAYDISSVFVKGFVAAIVVYLTATGGLAIVGDSGGGTPNPYVVFAACLVGAVFSEDVWVRAREKFFPPEGDGAGGAPEAQPVEDDGAETEEAPSDPDRPAQS